MNPLKEFYLITANLIHLLTDSNQTDRDEKIDQINQHLLIRGELIQHIKPPFSEGEIELGRQIIRLNEQLHSLLEKEKNSIYGDLQQIKRQQKFHKNYLHPYASGYVESMFYDKKK